MPMGRSPAFPEPKHFEDSSSDDGHNSYLHAPQPQRVGRQIPQLDSEEALGSAEPLRSTFDQLHPSDTPYNTSYSPRNISQPTQSPPPPAQFTHTQTLNANGHPSPQWAPNTRNADQFSSPPLPSQVHHTPEESYDSFQTAHTASPEPMTVNEFVIPPPQPSSQQKQSPHIYQTPDGTRGQGTLGRSPRLENQQSKFDALL